MIKEAIEKIASLATPQTYQIGKDTYTNTNLTRVEPHIDRPSDVSFSSLDGVAQAIKTEIDRAEIQKPIFVNVQKHDYVRVFTTYREDNMERDVLYTAKPDLPQLFSTWCEHDDAIIMLRSRFVQNEDTEYLLDLLSRISSDDSVKSEDNGVSQTVSATVGVSIKSYQTVRPRVSLAPFRVFLEVEQPESEFILRIKAGDKEKGVKPQIGIIEADGGAWKLAAKRNVADYFRTNLYNLVTQGRVIVTE